MDALTLFQTSFAEVVITIYQCNGRVVSARISIVFLSIMHISTTGGPMLYKKYFNWDILLSSPFSYEL